MHDMLIIGAGAAGMAAAMYAYDKHLDTLIIAQQLGGKAGWQRRVIGQRQLEPSSGEAVVRMFADRVAASSTPLLNDRVLRITKADNCFQVETEHHGVKRATTVVIASGVSPIPLDVPGAEQLLGYGLGYSPTTHAQALEGKTVAAIGTTPRALRGVHELSRIAAKVYWVGATLDSLIMPLGLALQYRPNVEVLEGFRVSHVLGDVHVVALMVERAGHSRQLPVDAAFVDLGMRPNCGFVENLINTDHNGFIRVNDVGATSLPGIFAAGDATTAMSEQLLVAIGQGARAAMSAYDYVLGRS